MKRIIFSALSFALFVGSSFQLQAQSVSLETAKTVAANFYLSKDASKTQRQEIKITDTRLEKNTDETLLYVFTLNDNSFVIVANEQKVQPILAYGINEGANFDAKNEAFNYWVGNYKAQIEEIKKAKANFKAKEEITNAWMELSDVNFDKNANNQKSANPNGGTMSTMAVSPLLTTTWDQGSSSAPSYNYYCPSSSGSTAITGCVATAMAQVLRYYQHPMYGKSSHSYVEPTNTINGVTYNSYGTLSANFGTTTYDWANMPASINSASPLAQKQAIGRLMSHCGISVDMDYSPAGSGANTPDVAAASSNYFFYSNSGYIDRSLYTLATWKTVLKNALDAAKPMVYRGRNTAQNYGHAWVCDGYDASDYFHMNWGWSGSSNGYFSVDDLSPSSYTFNNSQGVIINTPLNLTTSISALNICYGATNSSVSITTTGAWTITDNATWITTSAVLGSGNASFTINATQNTTGATRTGTVTVKGNGKIRTITVTQKPQVAFTSVGTFYPGSFAAQYSMSITSTGTFTVSDNAAWITPVTTSGTAATTTLTFRTLSNTTGAVRSSTIYLTGPCGESYPITITQSYVSTSCPTVTTMSLTNITQTSMNVTFNAVAGATFYRVYYKKATDVVWTWKGSWASSPVPISGLVANTSYNVRVEAACSSTTTGNVSAYLTSATLPAPISKSIDEDELFVTSENGLSAERSSFSDLAAHTQYQVYPNPASDNVNIAFPLVENTTVSWTIYTINGQVVAQKSENATAGDFQTQIALNELPDGLYILAVKVGEELHTDKIQVLH